MVRRALEMKLDLQEGALDDEGFRAPLKSAIKEAAVRLPLVMALDIGL